MVPQGSSPQSSLRRGELSAFLRPDVHGTESVAELSAVYHAERQFALQHTADLAGFLSEDRFGTTCIPSGHVRFLRVLISLERFSVHTGNNSKWFSPKFHSHLKQHYVAAVKSLDLLKPLTVKRAAKLLLRVDCRTQGGGPKFAEVLMPFVYTMKEKGWTILIDGFYGSKNDEERTAVDFNYKLTRKEWENKMGSASAFVGSSHNSGFCLSTDNQ